MSICDTIKKRLKIEFKKQDKSGIYGYTQKVKAYNSNRIEGSTLTQRQTASIFETGTLFKDSDDDYFITKDIEEMTGHFKMFNYVIKNMDESLSIELIKGMHRNLKEGVFEDIANGYAIGDWKKRVNYVSNIKTAKPNEVEQSMNELVDCYKDKKMSIDDIAIFHAKFENIHPFQDGNGRVGRMILFKQCLDNDMVPIIIRDNNKLEYTRCLNKAQIEKDYSSLIHYFKKEQKDYLLETIDLIVDYDILEKIQNKDDYVNKLIENE